MYDAIFVTPWPWWIAGPALGLVVTLTAFALWSIIRKPSA